MSDIAFAMLNERGHLIPAFKIAKSLKARGHRVRFFIDENQREFVSSQGFESVKVFSGLSHEVSYQMASGLDAANDFILDFKAEIYKLLKTTTPDLLLVDALLPSIALTACEAGIPNVMVHTNFETRLSKLLLSSSLSGRDESSTGLIPSLNLPELVLCPKEFDFPHTRSDARARYYVEASVDLDRLEPAFPWHRINSDKPLIYCSLGTQNHFFKGSKEFFQTVIDAMSLKQDWQMVLSIGAYLRPEEFRSVPPNLLLVDWAPQLQMLRKTSIMITHGGLGTVKECIIFGVPMIVFPLIREQPQNAARVVYHGLGLRADVRKVTAEQIVSLIEQIEHEPSFKLKIRSMADKFKQRELEGRSVKIIEKILSVLENRVAQRA